VRLKTPRYSRILSGLLLGLTLAATRLSAQAAAVLVRDGAAGPPVAGAIVRLLRGDTVVVQGLTSEAGRVTLGAPAAGRYALQVSRIGYAVSARTPVELAAGETRSIELAVTSARIMLPELIVEARTPCGKVTFQGALAATLWEQIRQALAATSLSERRGLTLNWRSVDRSLSASGAIREEQISYPHLSGSRPFVPAPAAQLAEYGYVRADGDSVVYSAPDAELLLSDPFVENHCFGVRRGEKSDSLNVGLSFVPLKTRKVADIRGVLWVDRRTLELRALEFQYASSVQSVLESNAGGRMEFDRLPSGAWYIRSWFIRMPEIVRTTTGNSSHDVVVGNLEHGGISEPLEAPRRAVAAARLSGRVIDSLGGGGLAGVVVSVAGAAERGITDSLGEYAMAVPVSGMRMVTFAHPLLALDTLRGRRVVELAPGGASTASTSTPGPELLLSTLCPRDRGKAGLMGRTITGTGGPAAGVAVRARWSALAASVVVQKDAVAIAGESGFWSFCDLPPGASVALRVAGRAAEPAAVVEIEAGRFPWLTLVAKAAAEAAVATVDSAQRLPELTTSAKIPMPPAERFLSEIRDRIRRNGAPASALITRDELAKSGRFRLADLLVSHGLNQRSRAGKQTLTCPRRTERPAIIVDGLLVDGSDSPNAKRFRIGMLSEVFDMENLSPDDVEAVEVYRSPAEWPAEFPRTEASCLVVIWSRRGAKQP
jgi:hypothetical protein